MIDLLFRLCFALLCGIAAAAAAFWALAILPEWLGKRRAARKAAEAAEAAVLAVAVVLAMACLIGVCMAEPQPVDDGWQRSDGVPAETPVNTPVDTPADAPPETTEQAEPEAAAGTAWLLYGAVGACGLFALAAAGLWIRRRRR